MRLPRPDLLTLLLAAIGVLGAVLVLLRVTAHGPGAGVDSAWFVSTARSLLQGDGFLAHLGAYDGKGPFFPLALAGIGLLGPDPLDAAGWLNAAAFGLTVFVAAAWVRSRTRSGFLAAWAGLACALSPLAGTASWAMSEPLFILWTTLSLFALDRFLDGRGRSFLLAAAVCAGLACATRYLGLALVASALPLLLLAQRRGVALPARARDASIFAGAALAPLGAWALHNLVSTGSAVGRLFPTGWNTLTALHRTTGEFARWTLGEGGYARLRAIAEALPGGAPGHDGASVTGVLLQAAVPLAAAAGAAAAVAFLRRRGAAPGGLLVPVAFAAVYAPVTLFMNWRLDFNLSTQPRYFAPLYPPLLVAAAIVLGGLLREAARRGPRVRLPLPARRGGATLPALALGAALALWLPQQALAGWDDVRSWRAEGRGATGAAWDGSALLRWLRAHPSGDRVWSNLPHVLYLAADLRTDYVLLRRLLPEDAEGWIAEARAGRAARVVWAHQHRPAVGDAAAVAALPGLELEALLDDGAVFRAAAGPEARGLSLAAAALDGARPLAESAWDLHLDEARRRLVYVRDGCARADTGAFFLHVWPVDPSRLPAGRRVRGFEEIRFSYPRHGFAEDGRCVVTRDLPPYPVAELRTGQDGAAGGGAWAARAPVAAAAIDLAALRAGAERLDGGAFEVYRDGNRLVYAREGCAAADIEARFFLHVVPLDPADLPEERRESGFDNLDFAFGEYGALSGGRCAAARPLPAYGVASIRTGQWVGGEGELWSVEAAVGE